MSQITENPRGGCTLAGINSVLSAIQDVCPIYHSGPGCNMQNVGAEHSQAGIKLSRFLDSAVPGTNMIEKDVVFGGIKKLKSTVQGAVEVFNAKAYFILNGCTSGIIGDDIESVALEYRQKGYEVYAVDTPGFTGDSNYGYETIWNKFIEEIIEKQPVDDNLVNIFGIIPYHDPFWNGNLTEIKRILERIGLRVNTFYTDEQNFETVKTCSAAALNIVVHPWIFKGPAQKFEEKFHTPWIRIPGLPIGGTDTSSFLRTVGEKLNIDSVLVEKVIYEEEKRVYTYLSQAMSAILWKRFAVVGEANSAVGITRYLANDYSFTPSLVIISEPIYREEDKQRIIEQVTTNLEYAKPPKVVFAADQYIINQELENDENISLIVGSSNEREAAMVLECQYLIATFPIKDRLILDRAIAGYKGSLTFTEDLYYNL